MKSMNLLKNTKRGSYILEASISLPIFIIGVIILSSIIGIVSRCENVNYILCDEALRLSFSPLTSFGIETRICDEGLIENVSVKLDETGTNKVMALNCMAKIEPKNVFDLNSLVIFKEKILFRPFIGANRPKNTNLIGKINYDDTHIVFVFPDAGKKYHKRSCTYVNSYPSRMEFNSEIKGKYKACQVCNSDTAKPGDMVYCFEYGDSYHLRNCPTITKYVVEMDQKEAQRRGYTPCSKCGG